MTTRNENEPKIRTRIIEANESQDTSPKEEYKFREDNSLKNALSSIRQDMKDYCLGMDKFVKDNRIIYKNGEVEGFWGKEEIKEKQSVELQIEEGDFEKIKDEIKEEKVEEDILKEEVLKEELNMEIKEKKEIKILIEEIDFEKIEEEIKEEKDFFNEEDILKEEVLEEEPKVEIKEKKKFNIEEVILEKLEDEEKVKKMEEENILEVEEILKEEKTLENEEMEEDILEEGIDEREINKLEKGEKEEEMKGRILGVEEILKEKKSLKDENSEEDKLQEIKENLEEEIFCEKEVLKEEKMEELKEEDKLKEEKIDELKEMKMEEMTMESLIKTMDALTLQKSGNCPRKQREKRGYEFENLEICRKRSFLTQESNFESKALRKIRPDKNRMRRVQNLTKGSKKNLKRELLLKNCKERKEENLEKEEMTFECNFSTSTETGTNFFIIIISYRKGFVALGAILILGLITFLLHKAQSLYRTRS